MLAVVDCLTTDFPTLQVLVAGGGDLAESIRADAAVRGLPIHFLGWRTDIATIFAASDVTLLTSDNEGTPVSLIQSGLCGVPSVATDVGSVEYVVPNLVAGLVVAPTTEALCRAASTLLQDEALRRRLGEGARAHAQTEFSVDTYLTRHVDVYRTWP
jgi:glycosyltransferase involved in cell wall biosynthesis